MLLLKMTVISLIGLVVGCKNTKVKPLKSEVVAMLNNSPKKDIIMAASCPEDGTCSWKVLKDTNFVVKEDTIGSMYPVLEKETGVTTIMYEYTRNVTKGVADGSYRELLYIRVPTTKTTVTVKDDALQEVGLLYGRLCYCRGASGYYPVTKGTLKLTKTLTGYEIQLSFENGKIPQITNNLEDTIVVPEY